MTWLLSPHTATWLLAILALIMPAWCWLAGVTVLVILPVELRTIVRKEGTLRAAAPLKRGVESLARVLYRRFRGSKSSAPLKA
jgi:hypothetical protein